MASSSSETSYWIQFFMSSGIPAGDAAHYAIIFTDNRITREMLMDLSKEYLTDMGITRLGDVIAILKHCKSVSTQEAKDKLLKGASMVSVPTSSPVPSRRSTAASRMVNHFTSKHPEAGPMSSPIPKLPPPDPPKSKRKVSIFERLGADDNEEVSISTVSPLAASPTSVFTRLGGKAGVKRPASESLEDSLPYAGVLKGSPSPAKKASITPTKPLKIKKTIKVVPVEETKVSQVQIQRPEVSTTTEGVLSDNAKEAPRLKDRLGAKTDISSSPTVSSSTPKPAKTGGIQARLGKKTQQTSTPVVSSSQQPTKKAAKPTGIFSRLGKKAALEKS